MPGAKTIEVFFLPENNHTGRIELDHPIVDMGKGQTVHWKARSVDPAIKKMRIQFESADAEYFTGKTKEVTDINANGKGNLTGKGPGGRKPINSKVVDATLASPGALSSAKWGAARGSKTTKGTGLRL